MKRIVSLILALSMVLSMFTFSFAGETRELKDVNGTKYEAAVEALMELKVVEGYPDDTYLPDNVVTRAELAKLLVVAYGLKPAAEAAGAVTPFPDANNHWASGYVNVSADYKFVNGYTDGSFQPDGTVTYAEAITMCLRVLGYANEIDAKGTWPTNYIAKAQDLKLMKDIEFDSYNEGAKRGNVALLIWNMLRTKMWEVTSESEGDGLVSEAKKAMINIKFPDYTYLEDLVVTDVAVDNRKVSVELTNEVEDTVVYELAEGTDFLKLFGRTVSVLYNKEDKEVVTITPSADDKVVEGTYFELVEDGYELALNSGEYLQYGVSDSEADYSVNVIEKRKVAEYSTYFNTEATGIVEEVKENEKTGKVTVKYEEGSVSFEDPDDVIVLIDGEWAYPTDIKVGDIVTKLAETLFVVNRENAEGTFESLTIKGDSDDYRAFIELDDKEYSVLTALTDEVVEVDEDGDVVNSTSFDKIYVDDESKFYGEDCTLYLNYFGEIVKVEFEEIEDKEEKGSFYVATNVPATWTVSDKSGVTTYVELNEESYEIKANAVVEDCEPGDVVFVKFDSSDRVTELSVVTSGDSADEYTFVGVDSELSDTDYLDTHKVLSTTVVYTILPVEDEDEIIERYEVEITKGVDALEGVESSIVAYETGDSLERARYVFVWEEAKNTEKTFGFVGEPTIRKGIHYIEIDGKEYKLNVDDSVQTEKGDLVAFVDNGEDGVEIVKAYSTDELAKGAYVLPVSGDTEFDSRYVETTAGVIDLDAKAKDYEDYTVLFVVVSEDDEEGYEFTSWEEIKYSEIKLKEKDVLAETKEDDTFKAIVIIRGFEVAE